MSAAILLIAHGSRRPEANADLVQIARQVAERRPEELVEIAYLELAAPDIPTGAAQCVARGATKVRMLPYFLSAGAHVQEDLQRFRDEFAQRFPKVTFQVCPPLGLHPKLIDVLLDRLGDGA
ncbi:MAG: sirohydrochlorin chelatase [Planctomycetaceae bacterium]